MENHNKNSLNLRDRIKRNKWLNLKAGLVILAMSAIICGSAYHLVNRGSKLFSGLVSKLETEQVHEEPRYLDSRFKFEYKGYTFTKSGPAVWLGSTYWKKLPSLPGKYRIEVGNEQGYWLYCDENGNGKLDPSQDMILIYTRYGGVIDGPKLVKVLETTKELSSTQAQFKTAFEILKAAGIYKK